MTAAQSSAAKWAAVVLAAGLALGGAFTAWGSQSARVDALEASCASKVGVSRFDDLCRRIDAIDAKLDRLLER